jgi:hypothetical protein
MSYYLPEDNGLPGLCIVQQKDHVGPRQLSASCSAELKTIFTLSLMINVSK